MCVDISISQEVSEVSAWIVAKVRNGNNPIKEVSREIKIIVDEEKYNSCKGGFKIENLDEIRLDLTLSEIVDGFY